MGVIISQIGNVAKRVLPLAVAGGVTGVAGIFIGCKRREKNENIPKTEIEMLKESVREKEMQYQTDSIEFARADSVLAKQDLAKVQELTKGLPMTLDEQIEYSYKALLGDKVAHRKLDLAENAEPLLDFAQHSADVATGKVFENSKRELEAEKNKLAKAQQDSVTLAQLDITGKQLDSLSKSMTIDRFINKN